jgi:hypothetical protein
MEIDLNEIRRLLLEYFESGRSIPIENEQERQGNSKLWEKDLCEFLHAKGYKFDRHDSKTPDFGDPFNLDVKTLRFDRTTKTFSVAPLTAEQALTGVLPYRMVVLLWKYDPKTGRGHPVDAVLIPKEARTILTNWSYKGIQVKSGISEKLIREKGLLAGKRL